MALETARLLGTWLHRAICPILFLSLCFIPAVSGTTRGVNGTSSVPLEWPSSRRPWEALSSTPRSFRQVIVSTELERNDELDVVAFELLAKQKVLTITALN